MSRTAEDINSFPQTEEARHEAIVNVARYWRIKFPGFEIRTHIPISEICDEPEEKDLRQVWLEQSFDIVALAGSRIALFQIFREDEQETKDLLESIGKIVQEHQQNF